MAAATGDSLDLSGRGYLQDPSAPDPIRPHPGDNPGAARDEFDDVLNYDVQIDDVFRDTNDNGARQNRRPDDGDGGLGIDEEVKIRKPRPKQAKLDETRLLGAKGLSELRKITKTRMKFRGKGHEFSDVSSLLNMYQLWLDDVFPKAHLSDCLGIIEKLGHSRRLQVIRREWIAEDKPKPRERTPTPPSETIINQGQDDDAMMFGALREGADSTHEMASNSLEPSELQQQQEGNYSSGRPLSPLHGSSIDNHESSAQPNHGSMIPEEDDLDQLLAEEDSSRQGNPQAHQSTASIGTRDEFADDLEAMAEMNDV